MPSVRHTQAADQDLVQIREFIAKDSPQAAIRWLDDIERACEMLAIQPLLGQHLQSRRFGIVRRHVVGNYVIYYRPASDGIDLMRVIHGARDHKHLF